MDSMSSDAFSISDVSTVSSSEPEQPTRTTKVVGASQYQGSSVGRQRSSSVSDDTSSSQPTTFTVGNEERCSADSDASSGRAPKRRQAVGRDNPNRNSGSASGDSSSSPTISSVSLSDSPHDSSSVHNERPHAGRPHQTSYNNARPSLDQPSNSAASSLLASSVESPGVGSVVDDEIEELISQCTASVADEYPDDAGSQSVREPYASPARQLQDQYSFDFTDTEGGKAAQGVNAMDMRVVNEAQQATEELHQSLEVTQRLRDLRRLRSSLRASRRSSVLEVTAWQDSLGLLRSSLARSSASFSDKGPDVQPMGATPRSADHQQEEEYTPVPSRVASHLMQSRQAYHPPRIPATSPHLADAAAQTIGIAFLLDPPYPPSSRSPHASASLCSYNPQPVLLDHRGRDTMLGRHTHCPCYSQGMPANESPLQGVGRPANVVSVLPHAPRRQGRTTPSQGTGENAAGGVTGTPVSRGRKHHLTTLLREAFGGEQSAAAGRDDGFGSMLAAEYDKLAEGIVGDSAGMWRLCDALTTMQHNERDRRCIARIQQKVIALKEQVGS